MPTEDKVGNNATHADTTYPAPPGTTITGDEGSVDECTLLLSGRAEGELSTE